MKARSMPYVFDSQLILNKDRAMVSMEGGPRGTGGNVICEYGFTPPQWTRHQKGFRKFCSEKKGVA